MVLGIGNGKYPTNVVLTAESVLPLAKDGTAQVIFYDAGVGTENSNISAAAPLCWPYEEYI
jgi:uncharacterized protein (DUF2235 family)